MSAAKKKPPFHSGKRFHELTRSEKVRFIGKALVFLVSGGFVFATMWVD